ncbi:MAG: hypothetical protein WCF22_15785 [Candidatus Sulfotelmatobacter sp.]
MRGTPHLMGIRGVWELPFRSRCVPASVSYHFTLRRLQMQPGLIIFKKPSFKSGMFNSSMFKSGMFKSSTHRAIFLLWRCVIPGNSTDGLAVSPSSHISLAHTKRLGFPLIL